MNLPFISALRGIEVVQENVPATEQILWSRKFVVISKFKVKYVTDFSRILTEINFKL